MGGQPPARWPDPAHEGLASGPPPYSATNIAIRPAGHTQPIHKMYCIIHQEALCAKSANLVNIVSVVVQIFNFILSPILNHRQFQAPVDAVGVQYDDLLYFCEVRWLRPGTKLARVCDLHKEIANLLRQKYLP